MPMGDASPYGLAPLDPLLRAAVCHSVGIITVVGRLIIVVDASRRVKCGPITLVSGNIRYMR